MLKRILPLFASLFISTLAVGQAGSPAVPTDGLALLQRVSQHYADAKSYRIDAVEESTTKSDYQNCWQKTTLVAAEASGNRFHYEGQSGFGGATQISDGKTVWLYHLFGKQYTMQPFVSSTENDNKGWQPEELPLMEAEGLKKQLTDVAKHYKAATRLPDDVIEVNGRKVPAFVVRVENADLKRNISGDSPAKTFWIDKSHETILKTLEKGRSYSIMAGGVRAPLEVETIVTYSVELDRPVSEALFAFNPPAETKLVQNFPDPTKNFGGPDLTGTLAPDLQLKATDGKVLPLSSFRGKPVLLDLWATWCAPCIKQLPEFAKLVNETKDKGLVAISIDQDEEAKTATDLLAKNGYKWLNFHDGDGSVSKGLASAGIPRTMLIDAQGKVVLDRMSVRDDELRAAIAKLGPEYASIAPEPKVEPCIAQK